MSAEPDASAADDLKVAEAMKKKAQERIEEARESTRSMTRRQEQTRQERVASADDQKAVAPMEGKSSQERIDAIRMNRAAESTRQQARANSANARKAAEPLEKKSAQERIEATRNKQRPELEQQSSAQKTSRSLPDAFIKPTPGRIADAARTKSESGPLHTAPSAEHNHTSAKPQSDRDPFAVMDRAIQAMEKANIAFNAPKTMNRADTVMIQLLLSMNQALGELSMQLKGKGEKETAVVPVAGIMEARLTGPNFEITATTPEEQPISRFQATEWRWDVKPKSIGEHDLHLTMTAIFDIDGTQRKRAIRTFDQIITVSVPPKQQVADFVNGNWQWLWGVAVAPLAGVIWQTKRFRRKRGGSPKK